ncbi:MAG: LCP family protein, partial [Anaerolineae bacterium]|nr:LCP family protein [Anaerolineae bacterium]
VYTAYRAFMITRAVTSGDPEAIAGLSIQPDDPSDPLSYLPTPVPAPVIELEPWDGSSRVTILLMGLDFRDWQLNEGPPRTDTMMLLTLDPNSSTGGILSLPRDLWVDIPGFGHGRINTAYQNGEGAQLPGRGAGLAVKTVEHFLGIKIHYFAQIDFGAFVHFINTIGCVKVDIPAPIKIDVLDTPWPITLEAGPQTMCGDDALAYARARNTEGGDIDRANRQQQVVLAMRDQLLRPDVQARVVANAFTIYQDIITGIQTNMAFEEAFQLGLLALEIDLENIHIATVSTEHVLLDTTPDGQKILKPIPSKIRSLRDQIFAPEAAVSPALLGLSPTQLMQAEAAVVAVYNGTVNTGLAGSTRDYLISLGVNVTIADSAAELQQFTKVVDYTGNPYTLKFLIDIMGIQPNRVFFEYDPNRTVDVEIFIGNDWVVP